MGYGFSCAAGALATVDQDPDTSIQGRNHISTALTLTRIEAFIQWNISAVRQSQRDNTSNLIIIPVAKEPRHLTKSRR
jgi:hypothetical protein